MSVSPKILIAHAQGEESIAERLAVPLRKAGYGVSHAGTVLIGESVVEEASSLLGGNCPVVLCGTVKALGTGWAHRVVCAARTYRDVRVFPIQMEEEAYIQQLALADKVGLYWQDPERTIAELISSLRKHFPIPIESADAETSGPQFRDFLQAHIDFYEGREWTRRAVSLRVANRGGIPEDASDAVLHWLAQAASRVLIVGGDFGSGKTWLTRRVCRDLAGRVLHGEADSPVPIFIPLAALHRKQVESFSELLGLASPASIDLKVVETNSAALLVVLDGLDELLVLPGSAVDDARQMFARIASMVPRHARLIVTCRTQVLESVRQWIDLLFEDLTSGCLDDRTGIAIDRALGRGTPAAVTFELLDLDPRQADAYLNGSAARECWRRVSSRSQFRDLATLPFLLFLLEEAFPAFGRTITYQICRRSTEPL